jgi:hypothetical protein
MTDVHRFKSVALPFIAADFIIADPDLEYLVCTFSEGLQDALKDTLLALPLVVLVVVGPAGKLL